MTFTTVLFVIIFVTTLTIALLHKVLKNNNNKLAHFINSIWYEWFEEQWSSIVAFIFFIIIAFVLGLALK